MVSSGPCLQGVHGVLGVSGAIRQQSDKRALHTIVVTRLSQVCAGCLANFHLREPYQTCQGPACQAWRHKLQPQQCAVPPTK